MFQFLSLMSGMIILMRLLIQAIQWQAKGGFTIGDCTWE